MQVTEEKRSATEVELRIEVEAEEVARTVDRIYREYAQQVDVPGFRRGKAPRHLLERYVSPESVRRRTLELIVGPAYAQALREKEIQPYADPELEIIQLDFSQPFIFKASVPLPPIVDLGEYKGIEVQRKVEPVTDEHVAAHLEHLRQNHATTEVIEGRGVQRGDFVLARVASALEGQEKGTPSRAMFEVGSNIEGFDENIIGMNPGESRTFVVTYPRDYPDENLAGKNVEFRVEVESIRLRHLPELDDDFAKSVGDFETLSQLRQEIRNSLEKDAEAAADREVERSIIEKITEHSRIEFPEVLVEHEVQHDFQNLLARLEQQGLSMDAYLEHTGTTEEQLLARLREEATRRLRIGLVMGKIAEAENLDVTEDDVNGEIAALAVRWNTTLEAAQAHLDTQGGKESLRNSMLTRKINEFLKSSATIR